MRIRFASKTDVGLLRERNEDSLLVFPRYRFGAVADGMGGHLSGDIASALAVATLRGFYSNTIGPDRTWPFPYDNDLTEEENCVVVGVRLANQHVFARARRSQNESGMGTTLVVVVFSENAEQVIVGHVGDSRCYRVRDGQLTQLTSDHSLVSEVTEIAPWLSEDEVNQLPSNVITRALGMAPDVVVDLLTTETRPGDTYLLCSDGLNGMLTDAEILETMNGADTLDAICERLVTRANAAGGNDNTTVVVARVEPDETESADSEPAPVDQDEGEAEADEQAAAEPSEDENADESSEGDEEDGAEDDAEPDEAVADDAAAEPEPSAPPAEEIIVGGAISVLEERGEIDGLLED
ncbi:MAG: serine/threonine-protein phosphatase [Deltaproteobacteria bacterium]|nr:serine/threonine-protein phosphatase [Deltaproteobacteria bacterium]